LYYTASGIITLCRSPSGVQVGRGLVGMEHVQEYNKLIIKQEFVH